jgi:hypothetical protein
LKRYHILKNSDVPLKATIFEKFKFTICKKYYPLAPHCFASGRPQISVKSLWHAADHSKRSGLHVFTLLFCGGADRRRKLADLLSMWQPEVKLFSPGSRPDTTEIGNESKR